jgi:hypothetical protein
MFDHLRWKWDKRKRARDNENEGRVLRVVVWIRKSRDAHSNYFEVCVLLVFPLTPFDNVADIWIVESFKDEGGALADLWKVKEAK